MGLPKYISIIKSTQSSVISAQETANSADTKASNALANASTAQSTAESAQSTAGEAQSTAVSASNAASNAQSTANAALARSGGAMTGDIDMSNNDISNASSITATTVTASFTGDLTGNADTSNFATQAEKDGAGNKIVDTYLSKSSGGEVNTVLKAKNFYQHKATISDGNLDIGIASVFEYTMNKNTTFNITKSTQYDNIAYTDAVITISLVIHNGGSYTATWSSSILWDGGEVPTLSTGTDILTFISYDGGTTWYGTQSMTDVA